MDRHSTYLWMKDLLEHLGTCYDSWDQSEGCSRQFLADSIQRDLTEFRRLCEDLRPGAAPGDSRRRTAA